MEGYLSLKTLFSRQRVYVILNHQQLTCYDKLELNSDAHSDQKGQYNPVVRSVRLSINVADAVVTADTKYYTNGLTIQSTNKNFIHFDCSDFITRNNWIQCLQVASRGENRFHEKRHKYLATLNILNEKISRDVIIRAYKRLTLKYHPDRGGESGKFNDLREAYEGLLSLCDDDDVKVSKQRIDYEAIIQKGSGSIGFGLIVNEHKNTGKIYIQSVNDNIILKALSVEAQGEIRVGDTLLYVEQEDCSHWTINRLKCRLSNLRVQVGASIHFTFERFVSSDINVEEQIPESPDSTNNGYDERPPRTACSVKSPSFQRSTSHVEVESSFEETSDSFGYMGPMTSDEINQPFDSNYEQMNDSMLRSENKLNGVENSEELEFKDVHGDDDDITYVNDGDDDINDEKDDDDERSSSTPQSNHSEETTPISVPQVDPSRRDDSQKRSHLSATVDEERFRAKSIYSPKLSRSFAIIDNKVVYPKSTTVDETDSSLDSSRYHDNKDSDRRELKILRVTCDELKHQLTEMERLLNEKFETVDNGSKILRLCEEVSALKKEKHSMMTTWHRDKNFQPNLLHGNGVNENRMASRRHLTLLDRRRMYESTEANAKKLLQRLQAFHKEISS